MDYQRKAIEVIGMAFDAYRNCVKSNNVEWQERHLKTIKQVCDIVMPHGSGLDSADIELDIEASKPNRLVFINLDFHHMNENGYYDGWSDHSAIVTPTFTGFDVRITGKDRDDINDYLAEMLDSALNTKLDYSNCLQRYVSVEQAAYSLGRGLQIDAQ